jgi:formylmethanofuran dehydrogenase subunit E
MLTMWALLAIFTLANGVWSVLNWRVRQEYLNDHLSAMDEIAKVKAAAMNLFRAAERSSIDQEHKVCSVCTRIVARHTTDESGQTVCVNCAKQLVKA